MHPNLTRAGLAAALFLSACGPTVYQIRGAPRMPGVDGTMQVDDGPGTNRTVTVNLSHLAPPDRMASGHAHYGVWFREPNGRSVYAGHLEYDRDDRHGHLSATTPLHTFEVIVTIERREHPTGPSTHVVIRQRVN